MTTKLKVVNKIVEILPSDDTTTYPRLNFNLQNHTYSVPLNDENPNDDSIAFSYKKGNSIYYVPKTMGYKLLVLINGNYKMSQIYPDIYRTMTKVPDKLDISNIVTMYDMFNGCNSLLVVPEMDTSHIVSTWQTFYNCYSLTTIPLLDTSNVSSMSEMFYNCASLTSVPQFNTSKVENMSSMFSSCDNLTTIPELNTSKVTNFFNMFRDCTSLPAEFPWAIDCSSVTSSNRNTGLDCIFQGTYVTNVTLKNVKISKSKITSQYLKGDNTLTINFI